MQKENWGVTTHCSEITELKFGKKLPYILYGSLREMVKTIVLRQDPPFRKNTGGLFMYPPPPTLKDGVLFV